MQTRVCGLHILLPNETVNEKPLIASTSMLVSAGALGLRSLQSQSREAVDNSAADAIIQ
jgi:hypothetical protein